MTTRLLVPIAGFALASCSSGVSSIALLERQAEWEARGPSSYSFNYAVQVMAYHQGCPSAAWAITVRNRVAVGAICIASSQFDSAMKTTVDSVFAEAVRIAAYGNVSSIQFDPTYGYPTAVVYSGPPDAGAAEQLSDLTPLDPPTSVRRADFVTRP